MKDRRVLRLNSLLKEVISEVLRKDMHHEIKNVEFLAVTAVEVTSDLHFAKVFLSFLGDEKTKIHVCEQVNRLSSHIAHMAMKKVRLRLFPKLTFYLDEGLEKQMRICDVLAKVLPHDNVKSLDDVDGTS